MKGKKRMCSKREKIKLEQVTLVAVTSIRVEETMQALLYSMRSIDFGDVLFLSDQNPAIVNERVRSVQIEELTSIDAYNYFILYDLYHYIHTEYALLIQWDGFVVNPYQWREDFLKYDYIGAPWPEELDFRDEDGNVCRVGNGGASLRSMRMMKFPEQQGLDWNHENEDTFLCCKNGVLLENDGLKIAPLDVAVFFSHERTIPEIGKTKPFMFHQWGGNNAQYPDFSGGYFTKIKKLMIRFLVYIDLWNFYNEMRGK